MVAANGHVDFYHSEGPVWGSDTLLCPVLVQNIQTVVFKHESSNFGAIS